MNSLMCLVTISPTFRSIPYIKVLLAPTVSIISIQIIFFFQINDYFISF